MEFDSSCSHNICVITFVPQPFWPLLLLPTLSLMGQFIHSKASWCFGSLILVSGTSYFVQSSRYDQIDTQIGVEFDFARGGQLLGETLNSILPQDPPTSLGVLTAGGVAYRYQGPVIDLLGLNNVAMGHSPGDRRGNKNHAAFHLETFFQLQPDLVNPRLVRQPKEQPKKLADLVPDSGSFWDTSTRGLFRHPDFRSQYRPVFVPKDDDESLSGIKGWASLELVQRLRRAGRAVQVLKSD